MCSAGRKAGEHKKRRRIGVDLLDPELGAQTCHDPIETPNPH
jgi:hypothetical protein